MSVTYNPPKSLNKIYQRGYNDAMNGKAFDPQVSEDKQPEIFNYYQEGYDDGRVDLEVIKEKTKQGYL